MTAKLGKPVELADLNVAGCEESVSPRLDGDKLHVALVECAAWSQPFMPAH